MKRYLIYFIIVLVLSTLVVIKVVNTRLVQRANAGVAAVGPLQVEGYVLRDSLITFPYQTVGILRANERVDIISEMSLKITAIPFREGSMVQQGAVLFELDKDILQAEHDMAYARWALASETEKRDKQLLATGGISQQHYDEALNQARVLEAGLRLLQAQLLKTTIRAPFSGRIGLRDYSRGAFVQPGMVLAHLEDVSSLKVDFSVPESMSAALVPGTRVDCRMEGQQGSFPAKVEAVEAALEGSTGKLKVRALIEGQLPGGIPGRMVILSLQGNAANRALYLPAHALVSSPAGKRVYRVEQGKAQAINVLTGLRSETMVEVIDGLEVGDTVLVSGLMKVKAASPVHVIKTW